MLLIIHRPPPVYPLFPYTTLFRSRCRANGHKGRPYWHGFGARPSAIMRSEEYTSELQSPYELVCRLLLEKKKKPAMVTHGIAVYRNGSTSNKAPCRVLRQKR